MDKQKALKEISLCEVQIEKFKEELAELQIEITAPKEAYYCQQRKRAAVKNRINVLRNDLLQLRKTLYDYRRDS